jgi:hypothetical protein
MVYLFIVQGLRDLTLNSLHRLNNPFRTANTACIPTPGTLTVISKRFHVANPPLQHGQLCRDNDMNICRAAIAHVGVASGAAFTVTTCRAILRASEIAMEEGFECRSTGTHDSQVALDSGPHPHCIAKPCLVVRLIRDFPDISCTNDTCNTHPRKVSRLAGTATSYISRYDFVYRRDVSELTEDQCQKLRSGSPSALPASAFSILHDRAMQQLQSL